MQSNPHPAVRNLPLCQAVTLDALGRLLPRATIEATLTELGMATPRTRKLDLVLTVLLVVAMSLYAHDSLPHVLQTLVHALRLRWPTPYRVPNRAAISYRRAQLGARPLVALFHRLCRPLATPQTPGAFLGAYRLMALDGTMEAVADTPANLHAYGRGGNQHGACAYPQVQCVYLVECGTHAIVDAGVWPGRVSEVHGARRLLRSLAPDMLVLWDRGLHSYDLIRRVLRRGAHFLGRVPSWVRLPVQALLPDGSYLATLRPRHADRRPRDREQCRVRVIEYVIPHPTHPDRDRTYRLITNVLDWQLYPAHALAAAYQERWEIETTFDELSVHLRPAHQPLRSRTPVGVVQELYGSLLAHYAIRTVMHEAACQQALDPDRLSFVHAVRTIRRYVPDLQATPARARFRLYQHLLADIVTGLLPLRNARSNPRLMKRRINRYSARSPERIAAFRTNQPRGPALLI